MNKISLLIFGNLINFIKGDSLVIDRFFWFKKNLPLTKNNETLLDIGCGSGAFTLEATKMGYLSTGMSWDKNNQKKATLRSAILKIDNKCKFPILDARELDKHFDSDSFNYIVNFENIEHINDDIKLFRDMYKILKPGGFLLLTTPNYFYKPMSESDLGPFSQIENGGHVRRGYSKTMLKELCNKAGFKVEKIDYCSGYFSQLTTRIYRIFLNKLKINLYLVWFMILPFRALSLVFELLPLNLKGNCYTICLVAYKPRFSSY